MKYFIASMLLLVGCGNTEYVTREVRVEDRTVAIDVPDIHVVLPGVRMDSIIVADTPIDSVQPHKPRIRTRTNVRTNVVTVDVVVPDTTISFKDTTLVQNTTVVEKKGFFDDIQTIILVLVGIAGAIALYKIFGKK